MKYPVVMSERETLAAARAGRSIARYGDGELRLCVGGSSISQRRDTKLGEELRAILRDGGPHVLPCIPNTYSDTPRRTLWESYSTPQFTRLYDDRDYGSSFITRPDNAPWIDRPDYWAEVRMLWAERSVAYVGGQETLLRVMLQDAASVSTFMVDKRDAYNDIDSLTRFLLARPFDAVIISAGAAGTVLAGRLAGAQHALDLGHIGMFMENPGAFSIEPDELVSPSYRRQLRNQHARTHWGKSGHSWADKVAAFAKRIGAEQALDYGCGSGTLKPALAKLGLKCAEYDPGIVGKDILPKLADLVVSTDVFEHIEPENVANVLAHTRALARKGAFFAIAKQPAKAILDDGRNAHLVCKPTEWWVDRLVEAGWARDKITVAEDAWKKCVLLCLK